MYVLQYNKNKERNEMRASVSSRYESETELMKKFQNKIMLDLKNSISQMKASGESFASKMIHVENRDLEMKDKVEELNL